MNFDDIFSRFGITPEHSGPTDRRTDGRSCYINNARCVAISWMNADAASVAIKYSRKYCHLSQTLSG